MIINTDIMFLLSGGSSNTDPLQSLGGDPSAAAMGQIFNDITTAQSTAGYTDYRCIYIANNNSSDALFNASVYIANEVDGGVPVALGFNFQNDIQEVNVTTGASVTGGSMTLQYEGTNFTFTASSNLTTWTNNFQTAIRAISGLGDVVVTGGINGTTVVFQVNFVGAAANRFHSILEVVSDALTPIGSGHTTVLKIFDGAPINSIATEIDSVTTTPNGILFYTPGIDEPLLLGDLRGTDLVPIWVRRVCPAGQTPLAGDGFSLKLAGNPFN